jgi:hypothetical protein
MVSRRQHAALHDSCAGARLAAGGEGAPELQESVQNFGINVSALAVLSYFLYRDIQKREVDLKSSRREEALGRLQVRGRGGGQQLWFPVLLA